MNAPSRAPHLPGLPAGFESTRATLHRIAAHVLGRRRYNVAGRFGLRASPGGFATPAFGHDVEIIRVDRGILVREVAGEAAYKSIERSTLAELAAFAGTDLAAEFSAGKDTPAVGDPGEPIEISLDACAVMADWLQIGWEILDETIKGLPPEAEPAVIQLWPEHFDAGANVGLSNGSRVNIGVSPGDAYSNEPYLYVGPWTEDRPGDPSFWNAPFGAALPHGEILAGLDPVGTGVKFTQLGLALLNE